MENTRMIMKIFLIQFLFCLFSSHEKKFLDIEIFGLFVVARHRLSLQLRRSIFRMKTAENEK